MNLLSSDLILLHAPSVYDFRKKSILYGPISDVIPSTPVFEMYPIGFSSLLEYLYQRGMKVRIINLAYLMLTDRDFDAEQMIWKLKCAAFGIDLHWLPHAQGSLEVATLCCSATSGAVRPSQAKARAKKPTVRNRASESSTEGAAGTALNAVD